MPRTAVPSASTALVLPPRPSPYRAGTTPSAITRTTALRRHRVLLVRRVCLVGWQYRAVLGVIRTVRELLHARRVLLAVSERAGDRMRAAVMGCVKKVFGEWDV